MFERTKLKNDFKESANGDQINSFSDRNAYPTVKYGDVLTACFKKSGDESANIERKKSKRFFHTVAGSSVEKGSRQILQASSRESSRAAAEDDDDPAEDEAVKLAI